MESLSEKLSKIQSDLASQETTLHAIYKNLYENPDVSEWDKTELRSEYNTYLSDYEVAYEKANKDYQSSIEGLSESYLSMCPFYNGPSLPKSTFIDSPKDICDLYGLFIIMGIANMYGIS